jgi:hypothetical protein
MTVEKLSQVLWRERELLDALLYRLEVEQLVLASGRTQLLMRAAADVESVLTDLRETEILRAMTADEAAAAIGLGHNPSLRALAEALEEPWQTIMLDHREAFVRLSREISALGDTNRELLAVGLRSARETLLSLHDEGDQGYRPDGAKVLDRPRHQLVDRSL